MTWDQAVKTILALKPGDRLRKADDTIWHVRGVLVDDERVVVRRWYPRNRRHWYEIVDTAAFVVGLFRIG